MHNKELDNFINIQKSKLQLFGHVPLNRKDWEMVEKELKALEIIKEHFQLDLDINSNSMLKLKKPITAEAADFLEEVLKE